MNETEEIPRSDAPEGEKTGGIDFGLSAFFSAVLPVFFSMVLKQIFASPWIILPGYVALRSLAELTNLAKLDSNAVWFSIPDLYLSALLVLWAAARFKTAAIAPAMCLMTLKIVTLNTGLIVIAESQLLQIPILLLALKYGLDPQGMARKSAATRATWVDMAGLILISALWVRFDMGNIAFEAYGGGSVCLLLFFLVRPRPLWAFFLLGALFFLMAQTVFWPVEVFEIFGDWQAKIVPYFLEAVWSPFVALILVALLTRYRGDLPERLHFSMPSIITTRGLTLFWYIVFMAALLPVFVPALPFGVTAEPVTVRLISPAILGLLIACAGFLAVQENPDRARMFTSRQFRAILLPVIVFGLVASSLWMQDTSGRSQSIIGQKDSFSEGVTDLLDLRWLTDIAWPDVPYVLPFVTGQILQVFLLFWLAFRTGVALGASGDAPEWPAPARSDDSSETGRLALIFGTTGRNVLITLAVMQALICTLQYLLFVL